MSRTFLKFPALAVACSFVFVVSVSGQDSVRYYEENGATIREARSKVQVPVTNYTKQTIPQVDYQPQTTTGMAQVATPTRRPVTQYRWVPKWHGRWNILRGPHLAYHLESQQQWANSWQTSNVPVTNTTLVPHTRTAQVTVPTTRYEEREQVTRTVMLPANRNSLVTLPSDRMNANASVNSNAAQMASNGVANKPFDRFATHPRYAPLVASNAPVGSAPPLNIPSATAPAQQRMLEPPALTTPSIAALPPATNRAPMLANEPNYSAPRVASQSAAPVFDPYGNYGRNSGYGGVARLDGDFPRRSTSNPQGLWQARQPNANFTR